MGIGGISIWQLLIILAIIVLIFGTKRMRNLGSDLGNALKGFKKAVKDEPTDAEFSELNESPQLAQQFSDIEVTKPQTNARPASRSKSATNARRSTSAASTSSKKPAARASRSTTRANTAKAAAKRTTAAKPRAATKPKTATRAKTVAKASTANTKKPAAQSVRKKTAAK